MSDFPRRLSDLTAEWVSAALGTPSTVDRIELTRIGEGRGMLGSLARIRLVGERNDLPKTLVVKTNADRPGLLEVALRSGLHRREVMFFAELAGQSPARVPACFGHWYDADTAEFLLLLEDIDADLTVDQFKGLDIDRAQEVVDQLALLHSRWWQDPAVHSTDFLQGLDVPSRRTNRPTMSVSGWPKLAALLEEEQQLSNAERVAGEQLADHLHKMLDVLGTMPATLVHGDLRLDNILFAVDGPVIVDWQGTCVGPPSFDLAYFLCQSLSSETRRAHSAALLTRYVEKCHLAGCAASEQDLLGGLGKATWFALGVAASLCAVGDQSDPRTAALAKLMGRRALDALQDHGEITEL
jgi:hypothetical protein